MTVVMKGNIEQFKVHGVKPAAWHKDFRRWVGQPYIAPPKAGLSQFIILSIFSVFKSYARLNRIYIRIKKHINHILLNNVGIIIGQISRKLYE